MSFGIEKVWIYMHTIHSTYLILNIKVNNHSLYVIINRSKILSEQLLPTVLYQNQSQLLKPIVSKCYLTTQPNIKTTRSTSCQFMSKKCSQSLSTAS